MTRRIKWRLIAVYLLVILVAMTVLGSVLSYSVERHLLSEVHAALRAHGLLVKDIFEEELNSRADVGDLNAICRRLGSMIHARITVYGSDNTVLGDSRGATANASNPDTPEPMTGMRSRFGCRICHSEVRSRKDLTVEVPLTKGSKEIGYVRLSASLYEAQRAAGETRRIILTAVLLTGLIAAGISLRVAGSIANPISYMNEMARKMASGDLHQRVRVSTKDEVGELAASLNVMADHLRDNLDQLAQEKNMMETILATMADGIVVTNRSGTIMLFNAASERLFGIAANEVVGRHMGGCERLQDAAELLQRSLDAGSVVKKDMRIAVPVERMVNGYSTPVRDQSGDVSGAVVVLQDVTEVRQLAEIRKDFAANVSHELRTPVASIRALVGALQSGAKEDPEVSERFLNSLDAETDRLSVLLGDLLEISELESGLREPRRNVIDLRGLVGQAVEALAEKAKRCDVDITVDVADDISAFVDRRQVQRVLFNLIENAIKYTPAKGRVRISACEKDSDIYVTVEDTGIGIPPAEIDRIFERFYRVDKARSRQLGGTGLGLSIVKDIVEAHGGIVTVESQVGKGSAFTFRIPRR